MLGISSRMTSSPASNRARTRLVASILRGWRATPVYSPTGQFNVTRAEFKRDFSPLVEGCGCYTCQHYTKHIHHLFKAKEMLSSTLCTIHNEHFTVNLVDRIRASIVDGAYWEFKEETLGRFYG